MSVELFLFLFLVFFSRFLCVFVSGCVVFFAASVVVVVSVGSKPVEWEQDVLLHCISSS